MLYVKQEQVMKFSTNSFSFKDGLFTQEISTLSMGGKLSVFHRVYTDACDEGLILVSDKTGREVEFVVDSIDKSDGDIAGWRLVPTKESIRKVPSARGLRMLIIND
jgi:hypothetical protein